METKSRYFRLYRTICFSFTSQSEMLNLPPKLSVGIEFAKSIQKTQNRSKLNCYLNTFFSASGAKMIPFSSLFDILLYQYLVFLFDLATKFSNLQLALSVF